VSADASSCQLDFYWNADGSPTWHPGTIASLPCGATVAMTRASNATEVAAQAAGNLYYFWNFDGSPSWQGGVLSGFAGVAARPR